MDPGSTNRQTGKLYYNAFALAGNGFSGYEISSSVEVQAYDNLLNQNIAENIAQLNLSVDDKVVRPLLDVGQTQLVEPLVSVVDVLPPILRVPNASDTFVVYGLRDTDFPTPAVEIIDNYDSNESIHQDLIDKGLLTPSIKNFFLIQNMTSYLQMPLPPFLPMPMIKA